MGKFIAEDFVLEPCDKERLAYFVGPEDDNLKQVERRLGVKISYSGAHFKVEGETHKTRCAVGLLKSLYLETQPIKAQKHPQELDPQKVHLAITEATHIEQDDLDYSKKKINAEISHLYHEAANFKTKRGFVKARSENQTDYIHKINATDICFGVGPAGTGKTYLAVAAAVDALERNEVRRIILTRPAVEAGEKLGFLPGDLSQKVDPYLRPLYDALFELLGFEKVEKLIEKQIIEIAPLAYMRGRTLNDSFIILDEAQNTTIEQMKMFLTRIGFNSHAVITGDPSQIDLPRNIKSGLKHAIDVLKGIDEIGFTFFQSSDVVRHPVVALIVNAYDKYDKEHNNKESYNNNKNYSSKENQESISINVKED